MQANRTRQGCVIILTALPVEYEAVRVHVSNLHEETYEGTVYERGIFEAGANWWEVGLAQIGMGNATAASAVEKAIAYFHPDVALFVGVAGGLKDVAPGDVVAVNKIYGYESGKVTKNAFLPRPDVGESSYSLIQRAMAEARKTDWLRRIQGQDAAGLHGIATVQDAPIASSTTPRAFVGPIAAGAQVLASTRSQLARFLKANYGDALAVEMEGRGFLTGIHTHGQIQGLVVRGISDLLDHKQQVDAQGYQQIASRHASAFAFEILAKLDMQPGHASGRDVLRLVDAYIHETDDIPVLDITLHNGGSQPVLTTRAVVEVLDVGEFYGDDDEDQADPARQFIEVSAEYTVELTPALKGKSQSIQIAHLLNPNEADRFRLLIEQQVTRSFPEPAYTWYYLKIAITCKDPQQRIESRPLLLSLPPVDMQRRNAWAPAQSERARQNRATLHRMSLLAGERSASVAAAIESVLRE